MNWEVTKQTEGYLEEIIEAIDFQSLNDFLHGHLRAEMTFEEIVAKITTQGFEALKGEDICTFVFDTCFYELSMLRPMFVKMLMFSLLFSVLHRLLMIKNKYISEISFLLIYATLMVLLMQSFLFVKEIAISGMDTLLTFLHALIPTFAMTLVFTGNIVSGALVYELAFGIVYLIESLLKYLLSPMIQIFILVLFLNHLFEEEKLSKLADLLEKLVQIAVKASFGIVCGLGVVQSLLSPVKDKLTENTILSGLGAIPGVGSALGSAGELILSCGVLIKNSVGVAGLIILFLLAVIPLLKIACYWLMYHVLAILLEPVGDQRIIACIAGVSRGCDLYFKIVMYSMLLFFVLFSMLCVATSMMY